MMKCHQDRHMIIEFALMAAIAAAGIVGTIVLTVRDGYGRVPARRA
jgi:hypothetical protein